MRRSLPKSAWDEDEYRRHREQCAADGGREREADGSP